LDQLKPIKMSEKVLVTYASKYGSTEEIASKICEILKNHQLNVDCISIEEVSEIGTYDAVIIGSAVYIGKWRKTAVNFLKKNVKQLSAKKTWIFSTGPTGEGDPVELLKGWKIPSSLEEVMQNLKPLDIKVFNGKLSEEKLSFMDKFIINKVKAPKGDFIDWKDIENWATAIAGKLK
jgi:menaquinone-dependent protoporphyrinogen oxidase